jgi:NAD(P)-dependent dehydrogenase (short-subunit alcohol dehydrogenase family)
MSILDKFSFRGKVAVVTGGNRGIGRAVAIGLAEAGASVAIAARDEKQNSLTLDEIRATGSAVIHVRTDVSSRDDLETMVETVSRELGAIDVLVNNAGIGFHADALALDDKDWERLFQINLAGIWRASQIVGRRMVKRGASSIVNIGSISGLIVNRPQWHAPYGVSKAAVHHLTRSLAAERAGYGVRVNATAPGYVKTEIANSEYENYNHY